MERTLVIKGLPSRVTVPAMTRVGERFGHLDRVVIEHDGSDQSRPAVCWMTFQLGHDAAQAVSELNGMAVGGKRVKARWSGAGSNVIGAHS